MRSVKRRLKKVFADARLTCEELLIVLTQIGLLNSRQLTYVYQDGETPLTPSQLVLGRRLLSRPSGLAEETSSANSNDQEQVIIKREKYVRTVLLHFWKRWQGDHLTQLQEYHRPSNKTGITVKVGDVVVVQEDNLNQLNWILAKVERLLTGNDGKVRASEIRYNNKAGNLTVTRRLLKKFYPVELKSNQPNESDLPIKFV